MSEIMPYIWIGIVFFASVAELHTLVFVPVLFIFPALAAFVLSLMEFQVWLQTLVFFALAIIFFVFSRTVFRRFTKRRRRNTNTNSYSFIGKDAIVTQEINNYKNTGAVRINGLIWTALAEDDEVIYESGLVVTVIGMDGINAVCTR